MHQWNTGNTFFLHFLVKLTGNAAMSLCWPFKRSRRDPDFNLADIFNISDGGSITWYEPLPVETTSDVNVYHTNSTQLLEGATNATLSWNFSLTPDLSFNSLSLEFNDEIIGGVLASGLAGLIDAVTERFNFIWIPKQKATLMIFNVNSNESGTYDCVVNTEQGFDTKAWISKIQVDVVGRPYKLIFLLLFI